jgi:hypothetical protein
MGYTHNEFISNFSAVSNGLPFQIHPQCIELNDQHRQLVIDLGDEKFRKLGSLAIPCMTVTFKFFNYTQSARDDFLQRFDLYYHKGGG